MSRLVEHGLVTSHDDILGAHPLVREHFGRRLYERAPAAWRAAHSRLFDFLRDSTEPRPDTLEGLQPLYQAVIHGVHAGRHEEARASVYRDRILRGTGPGGFYSAKKLGAFGSELAAVASFFEIPWTKPMSEFESDAKAWLLSQAASILRARGRLAEAVQPMRAALEMAIKQATWKYAAIGANNLSELELTLGELLGALRDAERSVTYADRSGDTFSRVVARTTLADTLHQLGRRDEALATFRKAEAIQAKHQPDLPLLPAVRGFKYCDLLLSLSKGAIGSAGPSGSAEAVNEVERRTLVLFEQRRADESLLAVALGHLTLGRIRLYRALLVGSPPFDAESEVDKAVDGFHRASASHYLPRGLLTRAWLRSVLGDAEGAHADLDEAQEIANRGPMPLYLADVHLYRARLFHDRAALAEARRLVEKHGYGRRREELADLEVVADGW